jgi:hypothetical protein
MASYREEYYSEVDSLFEKLRQDPLLRQPGLPTEQEILDRPGSIQPVGWVRNASGDGVKSVEINIDGLAFWTSNGQRTLLYSGPDWGEIRQENIDGSNDVEHRLIGESTFEAMFAARLSGDTQDRAKIGINSSDVGIIQLGSGSAAPDVNLYRSAANILKTDDDLHIQNLRLRGAGTSFPSSPVTNDAFFRTDLGEFCQYDGTRWLGQPVTSSIVAVSGATTNSNSGYTAILARTVKIVRWKVRMLTLTTNNGSNFWTITLRDSDSGGALSGSHGSGNGSAFGTSTYGVLEVSNSDVITTSQLGLLFSFAKTGSPGALHFMGEVVYRYVYT